MYRLFSFCMAQQPLVGQGILIVEAFTITLSHTTLWTSDQPDAETSTWQPQRSQETDIYAPDGIRTHNPSKWVAADPRFRQRGHWDRPFDLQFGQIPVLAILSVEQQQLSDCQLCTLGVLTRTATLFV